MKTFVVEYRTPQGRRASLQLEAADRAALFAELGRRGITPLSVAEGRLARRRASRAWLYAVLAAAALLAVAGVWLLTGRDGSGGDERERTPPRIAEAAPGQRKPFIPPQRREVVKTGDRLQDALAEVSAANELVQIQRPKIHIPPGYTNRTFKTGVEQLMSWVFTVELGDMPMPIPSIGSHDRERLAEILVSRNEIKDSDSARAAEAKEIVDYAKKEMIQFIKEGGDPDDFLQYYFQQLRSAFELRNEAQQQYYELEEDDPELARQFAERVNEQFAEKGIKPIHIESYEDEEQ